MNPLAVLKRGYTAVRNSAGNVIGSVSGMSEGDDIRLLFSDGEAEARITDIKETGLLLGAEADD